LPAAKHSFVCKKRMMSSLAISAVDLWRKKNSFQRQHSPNKESKRTTAASPGMNISFVLDGVLGNDHGIRPLDLEMFRENEKKQPLRVASSCAHSNGTLFSKCFGTRDFFTDTKAIRADGQREGIFACLEASMTVPGATGPPVPLYLGNSDKDLPFFDAFCFEPLPYRSAVAEGATHVLVLCSRPDGHEPKTKPGVYEQGVAPLYFHSHDQPEVAQFFEQGGQQYIYAEDLLTLEHGKNQLASRDDGVAIPPPQILYGAKRTPEAERLATHREDWSTAHLLPLKVPKGTPELSTLEQDKDEVLAAVRSGFSAAFDLLAPAIGLKFDLTGDQAAQLVFPKVEGGARDGSEHLQTKVRVPGETIPTGSSSSTVNDASASWSSSTEDSPLALRPRKLNGVHQVSRAFVVRKPELPEFGHAETLLASLPGFKQGRLGHLAKGLWYSSAGEKLYN
jgi:hypothetical protein